MKIDLVEKATPNLSNPIVICGLPGSALVGKLAVDHLIGELGAENLAEIYADGLAPQVFVESNGTAQPLKNELLFYKGRENRIPDLIFFTADSQPTIPEAEYNLAFFVVDYLHSKFGAKEMITLGAFVTGEFPKVPKVYAAATEKTLLEKATQSGCDVMSEGSVTGMNGILLGIAKLNRMNGYSLLGETSGYALDPKASEALLVVLDKLIGVKVDLKELEERAKEAQSVLQSVEAMKSQEESAPSETEDKKKLGYIS